MLTATEIKEGLRNFYGTEAYHRLSPLHGKLVCSDGVAWLAENADCFWLIDLIASHQPNCLKDSMLRDMQFWSLRVENKKAVATCERDSGNVAFTQEIPFTDFPLDEIKLCIEAGECGGKPVMVCLLPSEH